MSYLLGKILVCLLLAFLLGIAIGWLLRRIGAVKMQQGYETRLDDADGRIGSLEQMVSDRDSRLGAIDAELVSVRDSIPPLEKTIAERDEQVLNLTLDRDTWRERVPELESQLQSATGERDEVVAELRVAQESLDGARTELMAAQETHVIELEEVKKDLNERVTRLSAAEAEIAAGQATSQGLQSTLDELTAAGTREREALQAELASVRQAESDAKDSANAAAANRIASQDATIVSLNGDLRSRELTIEQLRDRAAQVERDARERVRSTASQDALIAQLQRDLAASQQRSDSQAADRELARTELRLANSARRQLDQEQARLREQLRLVGARLDTAGAQAAAERATGRRALAALGARSPGAADGDARSTLRISESARRQALADLRRKQERIDRLEAQHRGDRGDHDAAILASLHAGTAAAGGAASAPHVELAEQRRTPDVSFTASDRPERGQSGVGSVVETAAGSDATRFLTSAPAEVDDLQAISGIGKKLSGLLNSLGIYQFRQVAALTRDDIDWLDERLRFKGRIDRDNWLQQARELHRAKYGADPE
ncbi:MAG: hypothetical protein AAF515_15915 [Pseudomonadota bacterium]